MNNTEEKVTSVDDKSNKLNFTHFPGFAKFILEHHLIDYIKEQLAAARELNVPLLKFFSHLTDEQLIEVSIPGHVEFLTYAQENNLAEQMRVSLEKWRNDQLAVMSIGKGDIAAEDITLITFARKQALLKFITLYTTDPFEIVEIIKELETFDTRSVTASANLYIDLLQERIQEHSHFIESIANTTPSQTYVYNIADNKLVYANKNYEDYFGLSFQELTAKGPDMYLELIHPDDRANTTMVFKRFSNADDNQVISWEQRLKNHKGEYRWIRHHASIFKRDDVGQPVEIVGIALDVDIEKRTAEQLLKSEETLLEAQELADMGSYEIDIETGYVTASPNFHRLTGMPIGFRKRDYIEKVHPGDKDKVNEAVSKTIAENGVYESEYRYMVEGKERIFWSRGKVFDTGGKKLLKGSMMDVTERHHMIQKLQRSEELYKQAQALSHIGNWSWYLATNRINWSEELHRIFGIHNVHEEITYERYLSFIHPDDKIAVITALEKTLTSSEPYNIVHRIILENGEIRIIQSIGEALLSDGKPYKLVGTGQDITNKYYTEQRLRENQEFIQKVANTTPSLIASYNINTGKYTYINKAFTNILGHEVDDVLEKGAAFFADIIHPDDFGPIMEKNAQALAEANANVPEDGNEPIVEFKYRLRHKNGNYRWFHTYGTIFDRNAEGKVEHVLNVSVDITDQEEAEQALHRKNIQLQQSNASLEEFAYVASHDLKEPLRKIATFGDRLLSTQYEQLNEQGRTFVDKIIDSSRRMQTMINDLLSISVISGNKSFAPTNLKAVLDDAVAALEYKIEEKGAEIKSDDLPTASIVVSQFRHLFQNLLSNSLKFSREGVKPEITIKCKYLHPHEVHDTSVTKAKKYLSISVSDNGIGFDNQYANKIFTIFQRLHSKTDYEGNGIGLAICRKIAENHGGTIFATGELNKGATFTVIIPS